MATGILLRTMLFAAAIPAFISEYLQLYVFTIATAFVVAIALLLRRLPGQLRSMRAASWPIAEGTVETATVKTLSGQALGELGYSYVVNGERYSGYVLLQFTDEQDAWETIDPLKGHSVFVRHHFSNPGTSAIRSADQTFAFSKQESSFLKRLVKRQVLETLGADWDTWARLGARNWPLAKGRVEFGSVTEHRDGATWFLIPNYTADVSYSYSVAGEYYAGHLERDFYREKSAAEFVDGLKAKGVFVRYNQGSPSISVLRLKDQEMGESAQCQPAARA